MRRLLIPVFAALALVAAACGDGDGDDTAATSTTADPSVTTTTEPPPTTSDADPAWVRCEHPEGFSIAHPAEWETNEGTVVEPCSAFDPDPFDVPEATDVRFAAVTAHIDQVAFADAATPGDDEEMRATTAVDGHQAVRVVGPAGELYDGETAVRYFVDLPGDADRTLVVDTLSDDEEIVTVLDRMVRTIELTDAAPADEDIVARYEGGGTPFAARLAPRGDDWCLTSPVEGESTPECFTVPSPDALRFADQGGDLFEAFGGVTGQEVFRVEVVLSDGSFHYLPVAGASDGAVRGWMVPVSASEVSQLNWYDIAGRPLGARTFDEEVAIAFVDGPTRLVADVAAG